MKSPHKVYIVGIGDDGVDGLTEAARELLRQAEILIGSRQLLSRVPSGAAERHETGSDLNRLVSAISETVDKRVVVLTTGDPLFYGVTRFLWEKLGKDRFEVVPHVSSMQLAFARVKESWDEAYLANLASVPMDRVIEKVRTGEKAGLFTTEACSPAAIAQALLDRGIDYFTGYVCENLGSPDERVTHEDLAEIACQAFAPLNVLILIRKPDVPDRPSDMQGQRVFGHPDEMFYQSKPKRCLVTPLEVRAISLALLDLGPRSIVWDVGAGSGSVAIEAAKLAVDGMAYAIERDPDDHQLIIENARRFGASNVTPVLGQAPEAWQDLPDPDAVFVGGTGRAARDIVELAWRRLRSGGRLVANISSADNLASVRSALHLLSGNVDVRMVNIAHSTNQLDAIRFEARNPTFLISAVKDLISTAKDLISTVEE